VILQVDGSKLFFVFLQLTLGFDEFPLEGSVLLFADLAFLELLIYLSLDVLQPAQFLAGIFNLVGKKFLFLSQDFRIMRIELEQPLNFPQLLGYFSRCPINILQRRIKPRGICAYLDCDPLNCGQADLTCLLAQ